MTLTSNNNENWDTTLVSSDVIVSQLKIDGKTLTKQRLANLPIICRSDALEGLLDNQFKFIARYPFHLFVKVAGEYSKLLGRQQMLPESFESILNEHSYESITGVVLYDKANKCLLNSCFVEGINGVGHDYAVECATICANAVDKLKQINNFQADRVKAALADLKVEMLLPELQLYWQLTKALPNKLALPTRARRSGEQQSAEESQVAFNQLRFVINQSRSEPSDAAVKAELKQQWEVQRLSRKLNTVWLENILEHYPGYDSWHSTKKWLLRLLEITHDSYAKKSLEFDIEQESLGASHQNAPFLFI